MNSDGCNIRPGSWLPSPAYLSKLLTYLLRPRDPPSKVAAPPTGASAAALAAASVFALAAPAAAVGGVSVLSRKPSCYCGGPGRGYCWSRLRSGCIQKGPHWHHRVALLPPPLRPAAPVANMRQCLETCGMWSAAQ